MTTHLEDEVLTVIVTGEADLHTAGLWREQLEAAWAGRPYAVVVDLSGLRFCGLAGLDALDEALARRQAEHGPAAVTGMSAQLAWLRQTFPPS